MPQMSISDPLSSLPNGKVWQLHTGEWELDIQCDFPLPWYYEPWDGSVNIVGYDEGGPTLLNCKRQFLTIATHEFWRKRYCKFGPTVQELAEGETCDQLEEAVCTAEWGNPIDTASGNKVETALDWKSPKDGRFGINRLYRSNLNFTNSISTRAFGYIWATEWAATVEGETRGPGGVTTDWHFHGADGSRLGFDLAGEPRRTDHKYSMTLANAAYGNRKTVEDGSGKVWVFGAASTARGAQPLEEVHWSDGYQVTFTYDANDNIATMADSRGQYAEYTWATNIILNDAGTTEQLRTYDVTNIEVDTDYDNVTFSPEIDLVIFEQALELAKMEIIGN